MSARAARDAVLDAVRGALGVEGADTARKDTVTRRLGNPPQNLVPARAKVSGAAAIELFTRMLESQNAEVSRVKTPGGIPDTIAAYLRKHNLPAEFRTGDDPFLAEIPWHEAPSLTRRHGRGEASDAVAISRARAAAAETGTLFLTSGRDNPTTLNFLPDTHIIVIPSQDILGAYEDAWNALRNIYGPRVLPRTVNLISGPSRTADIEQIIVMGAHGPRRLAVIIVG